MTIIFYAPHGPYGFLSNYSPHTIAADGLIWSTAEHYFQACKFPHDPARKERIHAAPSPDLAKKIAWEEEAVYLPDWFDQRVAVMRQTLRLKFAEYGELREKLLATADARLVERSDRDAFWGDGPDGDGVNMLGRLLMELRQQLLIGKKNG